MILRQGNQGTGRRRFRATLLSAVLSGLWMAAMSPAVEAAVLQSKSYEYDALGRVTVERDAANAVVASYTYDSNGNRLTRTDALNRVTTYEYDELNRLKKVIDPASGQTQYGYDARDNLVSVTDPRNLVTTYSYNGLDQLTAQASPDTGSTSYGNNLAGQVTSRTNAASQATTYQYDALGRVTQASYADGRVVNYGYDQGSNGVGRLTSIGDNDSSVAWTYDADGHVLTRTQTIGSGAGATVSVLGYAYNPLGQLASMTLPSGKVIAYTYDDQGRPASLSYDGAVVLNNIQYRPFGGISSWTWGNGQTHSRSYDANGRLDLVSVGGTVKDLNYDAVSRISEIQDLADISQNKTFSYDTLDRLTGYTGQASTRGWAYDADGNRTSQTIGSTTETYSYETTSNHLLSLTNSGNSAQNRSYQYTATGHTSTDGATTYTYDARERLVAASNAGASAGYTVNPLGQRVRKSVTTAGVTTTTTFMYDEAGRLVADSSSDGKGNDYIYLGDTPVAVKSVAVQSTVGTPIVVDTVTWPASGWRGNAGNNIYTGSAYGGSAPFAWAQRGAPAGIVVDNDNTNNVAPNGFTGAAKPWSVVSGPENFGATRLTANGNPGAHLGTILDSSQATTTGSWSTNSSLCTSNAYYFCQGGSYQYSSSIGVATMTWSTSIAANATYAIYLWVPNGTSWMGTNYVLQHAGGTVTITPPANVPGGRWTLLGSYALTAGAATLTFNKADGKAAMADAILIADVNAPMGYFNTVQWTANIPEAGTYDVYARTFASSYGGSASYTINHAAGATTVTKPQVADLPHSAAGAYVKFGWIPLGSYTFNQGLASVTLSDQAASMATEIQADAMLFTKPTAPFGYFNDVTWTPSLAAAGQYTVKAWWPVTTGYNPPASTEVWYTVYTSQGPVKVVKNQTQAGGQWVILGTFDLDPASAKVTLADYGDAGSRVIADAVSFTPLNTTTSNALYYIHADHLNTPRQLTTSDTAATTVWRWDGEPFGSTLANADPDGNGQAVTFNLRFPGQYFDAETQLHYNYFRDYDPSLGLYVQSDPIGLKGGLNMYAYVRQNPTISSDPFGLTPRGAAIGAVVGGAVVMMGSVAVDAATGGANVVATPNEVVAGAALGARVGDAISDALSRDSTSENEETGSESDNCGHCTPPVGTQCNEDADYGKPHAGLSPHYHIYEMQRKLVNGQWVCFWRYLGGKVGVGVLEKPRPGMMPCSSYPNFIGRGGR